MRSKFILKLLQKIAQDATDQLPTDAANKDQSVAGVPLAFTATSFYPTIIMGFGAKNIPLINGLSTTLNNALYYSSNGQVNLTDMKNNNFSSQLTNIPSGDLIKIMSFCQDVYKHIYTNLGGNYTKPLSPEQISEKIQFLNAAPALNNLPAVVSNSQLQAKLGGNLKTIIQNYLLQIK